MLWTLALIAIAAAVIGIALAAQTYLRGQFSRGAIEQPILAKAWGIDAIYAAVAGGPGRKLFQSTADFDAGVVDGAVRGTGRLVQLASGLLRKTQTGYVRNYALGLTIGVVVVVGLFLSKVSG